LEAWGLGANTNYSYDANGNLTSDGVHAYDYDAENRLTGVDAGATAAYAYDYQNRRIKKVASGTSTHYVWEGNKVIGEYDGSTGGVIYNYVYSGSRLIARIGSGVVNWYLSDRLSERLMLDGSGGVIGRMAHLPFGEDFGESGTQEKHHFTSYERDGETGTDYAVNRQYSQSMGRFNRPDLYQRSYNFKNPQTMNRYQYVENDPANLRDPLGLFCAGGTIYNPDTHDCEPADSGAVPEEGFGFDVDSGGEMLRTEDPHDEQPPPAPGTKTWQVDPKVLGKCIEDLYGVTVTSFTPSSDGQGGVFVGFGPDRGSGGNNAVITIRNDVTTYNKSQLKEKENAFRAAQGLPLLGPNDEVWGMTIDDATHNHYTNYTASDLNPLDTLKSQVHELGHSLALVTGIERNAHGRNWEQGKSLEKCMNQNNGWVLQ
jgi:RHS repeat-associated protein